MSAVAFPVEDPPARHEASPSAPMLWHDLANLFPIMEGDAFWSLVADVNANGVREPIVMFEGKVLDGRNRYLAARECGQLYPVTEYTGADPLAYVVSLNLKRRHLSEAQRAMVAGKLAKLPQGGNRQPDQTANWRDAPTSAEAAKLLNVGVRSVERAREIHEHGTPGLVDQVQTDQVSVAAATEVARLPEPLQVDVVAGGPQAVREVAAGLRKAKTAGLTTAEASEARAVVADAIVANYRAPGGRAKSRANPDHQPSPQYDAMASVVGSCRSISEKVASGGPGYIVGGFLNDEMRARYLAVFVQARADLDALMEACRD